MPNSRNVIAFGSLRNRDTIEVCKDIIRRAESGACTGIIFAVRENGQNHAAGATGDYKNNPAEICIVAGALFNAYSEEARLKVQIK